MNRIKELRNKKGISQAKLAEYLQIAQNTLSYWEQGKYEPDQSTLKKIADFFDVSVDYLLERTDDPQLSVQHVNTTLNPDVKFAFIEGFHELDDEDRAELNRMAARMIELKRLKDNK